MICFKVSKCILSCFRLKWSNQICFKWHHTFTRPSCGNYPFNLIQINFLYLNKLLFSRKMFKIANCLILWMRNMLSNWKTFLNANFYHLVNKLNRKLKKTAFFIASSKKVNVNGFFKRLFRKCFLNFCNSIFFIQ